MRTPAQFEADCASIVSAILHLRSDYWWAYGYAHSVTRGDSSTSVPIGQSDPTGSVAVEDLHKARVRANLERAGEAARAAASELTVTRTRLGKLMGTEGLNIPARGSFPRTVSQADLEASKAAQRRRRIRSEHYGG